MKLFVKNQGSKRLPAAPRASAALAMIAALQMSVVASAQIPLDDADRAADAGRPLIITTTAERVKTTLSNGRESIELLPADRLVAGDVVIYTLEVRNRGAVGVDRFAFTSPIPQHTSYIANSAVAPGADISFSVDGGRSFDAAENLTVHGPDGKQRPAVASDYTHIRWVLRNRLKAGSMTIARFRATVLS